MKNTWIQPGSESAKKLSKHIDHPISHEYSLFDLLKRPELNHKIIGELFPDNKPNQNIAQQIEVDAKYSGYISRQQAEIDRLQRHENTAIPADFDYEKVKGLSNEVKQKLGDALPETLARASRVAGVTPAAISLLLVQLKKRAA